MERFFFKKEADPRVVAVIQLVMQARLADVCVLYAPPKGGAQYTHSNVATHSANRLTLKTLCGIMEVQRKQSRKEGLV